MPLRDYQRAAIDALGAAWSRGLQRVGVSLPTGTGKTEVMIEAARLVTGRQRRVLFLLHRDTLVEQTVRRVVAGLPRGISVGIVKAAKNHYHAQVVVASVHTLRNEKRRRELMSAGPFALVIVDEAHVSVSDTYHKVYEAVGAFRSDGARMAGFTATWTRSDSRGLGDVWQEIVYQKDIRWAIAHGHLVKPRGLKVGEDIDMSGVRTTAGDYNEHDLGELVMVDDLRDTVVRGYLKHARGRHAVLFAPTVESANFFVSAFNDVGVRAEGIYHNVNPTDRRAIFARSQPDGPTKILASCTALSEGWDAPWFSAGLLVRPTKHAGLYIQQIGRVLRPSPGKQDAVILDFVSTTDGMTLSLWPELGLTPDAPETDDDSTDGDDAEVIERESESLAVKKIRGVHEVDLFEDSRIAWLSTTHGVPFIDAIDEYIFIAPDAGGTWRVGRCSPKGIHTGEWLSLSVATVERARELAELAVWDRPVTSRTARWRTRNTISSAQLRMADALGITASDYPTPGELSNAISVTRASRVLQSIKGALITQ